MKKWFIRVGGSLIILLIVIVSAVFLFEATDTNKIVKYARNENLPTIRENWQGTPVDASGRFVNHEFPFLSKTIDLLKWRFGENPFQEEKANDQQRLQVRDPKSFLAGEEDGILWLGHASFYIRLGGQTILIDPVFGKPPFIKTYVDVPNPLENIEKVDYLLVSHDHRDHSDEATIRAVSAKFPQAKVLTGLEMDGLLKDWLSGGEIETAGWYQQYSLPKNGLKISFLPTRHWARRGLFDMNRRLWGAFVIEGGGKTIYFGGDSGYGSHYRDLKEIFPNIDIFIVGIGAYEPRWFMNANHQSPEEAFRAFQESGAKTLIPMHFGRFELSDEPPGQPLNILRSEIEKSAANDDLKILQINESFSFR